MKSAIEECVSDRFALYRGDCVEIIREIPDSSIHYSAFSPPFKNLYVYSDSPRDLGNCKSDEEFMEHYRFLIPEQLRVTKPGRLLSFHCMLIPSSKVRDGVIGITDFRGDLIRAHVGDSADLLAGMLSLRTRAYYATMEKDELRAGRLIEAAETISEELTKHPNDKGWIFHSEVVIWKDPVTAMQRTKALGLLHKQVIKDSAMSRQGIPDYFITMRKPGINEEPVRGCFDRYFGEMPEPTEPYTADIDNRNPYSIAVWQRYASPVWMDINPSDTLQFRSVREHADERHIAPLQLSVIRRGVELWTNPEDVVMSPFAGIGSEGVVALEMGRRFVGMELKGSYYKQSCANLRNAERGQAPLFADEPPEEVTA